MRLSGVLALTAGYTVDMMKGGFREIEPVVYMCVYTWDTRKCGSDG